MKIPKHIQTKMHRIAKLTYEAGELIKQVDDFFANKGYDESIIRADNGISLTELDYGNDITEQFVAWAADDFKPI